MRINVIGWMLAILGVACAGGAAGGVVPDQDRGLYAIWYRDEVLALPYVKGGQVMCQWGELETGEGQYDFAPLRAKLEAARRRGLKVTVQVNGNRKPAWLFRKAPYFPKALDVQVSDKAGTLIYWHPTFRRAYTDFLKAYADFLKHSPYRENLLGIRLNFNAVGTEHMTVPPEMRRPEQWVTPAGVAPCAAFHREVNLEYAMQVVDTFVEQFSGFTRVFVRNNINDEIRARYKPLFESGRLAWFHTSSEVEPRGRDGERQYLTFLEDCRPGKTVGYAESWADAWGYHGKKDPRWCSPPQWNYWRLLADLHMGISFIAVYGDDLAVALNGKHRRENASQYQAEFDAAFRFAAKYAGYHASPAQAPGAWVAFRHSTLARHVNRPLEHLTGDYNFLMRRVADDGSTDESNAGPEGARYGAWARRMKEGGTMRLAVDQDFILSLAGQGTQAKVKVIYLDAGEGSFEIRAGGEKQTTALAGSGRWKTATLEVAGGKLVPLTGDGAGAQLAVEVKAGAIAFHMVEVERK